jgi:hypothetical protein
MARLGAIGVILVAFLGAFAAYELALFAASFMLPTGAEAFSLPVVWRIFYVNVFALAGLVGAHRVATALGLLAPEATSQGAPATT